jgi:hypothetical protein
MPRLCANKCHLAGHSPAAGRVGRSA